MRPGVVLLLLCMCCTLLVGVLLWGLVLPAPPGPGATDPAAADATTGEPLADSTASRPDPGTQPVGIGAAAGSGGAGSPGAGTAPGASGDPRLVDGPVSAPEDVEERLWSHAGSAPTDPGNAATWYYRIGLHLEMAPEGLAGTLEKLATGEPGGEAIPAEEAAAWEELLTLADGALACGSCRWPAYEEKLNYQTELPFLWWGRVAARGLLADAHRRQQQGRTLEALERIEGAFEVAGDQEAGGPLIASLVGTAIRKEGMVTLRRVLLQAEDADLHVRALDLLARQEAARLPIAETMRVELQVSRQLAEQITRGEAGVVADLLEESGELTDPDALTQAIPGWLPTYEQYMEEMTRALRLPVPQALRILRELDARARQERENLLVRACLPALARVGEVEAEALARLRGMRIWCAVQAYRLREGTLPSSLGEVAPLLSGVPDDPYAAAPPRYTPHDGRFRLWLLGPDLVDDGCDPRRDLVIEPAP